MRELQGVSERERKSKAVDQTKEKRDDPAAVDGGRTTIFSSAM
jgi:hypothetical protein